MIEETHRQLALELHKLKFRLERSSDTGWSVASISEVLGEVNSIITELVDKGDINLGGIRLLILPTSDLQEISIVNEWGDEFLSIAASIEKLIQ